MSRKLFFIIIDNYFHFDSLMLSPISGLQESPPGTVAGQTGAGPPEVGEVSGLTCQNIFFISQPQEQRGQE